MLVNPHGGNCCGIRHLFGFSGPPSARQYVGPGYSRLRTLFKRHLKSVGPTTPTRGKLVEVVLTDSQVKPWVELLKENDFHLVTRFHNSTGEWCNVFHKTTGNCRDDVVPDWWLNNDEEEEGVK